MNNLFRSGVGLLVLAMGACAQNSGQPVDSAVKAAVSVRTLMPQKVRDTIELDGVVAPMQHVNLVARVPGTLASIHFEDGGRVRKGQLLFTIEPSSYNAQLKLNQARLDQAESEYQRQTELMREDATSQASVDIALSNLQQSRANVDLARIDLGYTQVRAPFDGVMSKRLVDVGNYVGATAGGTVVATIMQIAPAYVNASVGEREALRLRQLGLTEGRKPKDAMGHALVRARLQGNDPTTAVGVLDFIDSEVNRASGTIAVRGLFGNEDKRLVPGFYAELTIELGPERMALLLPASATRVDPEGHFVFIVDDSSTAQRKRISISPVGDEEVEVTDGLSAGDKVVVGGQDRLQDGSRVELIATTGPEKSP